MKELSIEEKAKAYDEALEIARKINSREGVSVPHDLTICEIIFPELKMSEDEKIRKEIEVILANTDLSQFALDYTFADMLAWLEKQNENEEINEASYRTGIKRVLDNPESYGLKKQGEQKPAEWSEEDRIWIDRACMLLNELNDLSNLTLAKIPSNVNEIIERLKSLKDRCQPRYWKPSEEQIRVVARLRHCLLEDVRGNDIVILDNLLEQLKAL